MDPALVIDNDPDEPEIGNILRLVAHPTVVEPLPPELCELLQQLHTMPAVAAPV